MEAAEDTCQRLQGPHSSGCTPSKQASRCFRMHTHDRGFRRRSAASGCTWLKKNLIFCFSNNCKCGANSSIRKFSQTRLLAAPLSASEAACATWAVCRGVQCARDDAAEGHAARAADCRACSHAADCRARSHRCPHPDGAGGTAAQYQGRQGLDQADAMEAASSGGR